MRFLGKILKISSSPKSEHVIVCPKKRHRSAVRRHRLKRIVRVLLREYHGPKALYIVVLSDPKTQETMKLRVDWDAFLAQ